MGPLLLWMNGHGFSFRRAVARRGQVFFPNGGKFRLCRLKIRMKHWIGMQSRNHASPRQTAPGHVAIPMDVTYFAAFAKGPAPREDGVNPVRRNLPK